LGLEKKVEEIKITIIEPIEGFIFIPAKKARMEAEITRVIIEEATKDWLSLARSDVVIVGAGPAGLTAGAFLAERGLRTVIFERKLSFGGGIGGGGMLSTRCWSKDNPRRLC